MATHLQRTIQSASNTCHNRSSRQSISHPFLIRNQLLLRIRSSPDVKKRQKPYRSQLSRMLDFPCEPDYLANTLTRLCRQLRAYNSCRPNTLEKCAIIIPFGTEQAQIIRQTPKSSQKCRCVVGKVRGNGTKTSRFTPQAC